MRKILQKSSRAALWAPVDHSSSSTPLSCRGPRGGCSAPGPPRAQQRGRILSLNGLLIQPRMQMIKEYSKGLQMGKLGYEEELPAGLSFILRSHGIVQEDSVYRDYLPKRVCCMFNHILFPTFIKPNTS